MTPFSGGDRDRPDRFDRFDRRDAGIKRSRVFNHQIILSDRVECIAELSSVNKV